MAKAKKPAAKKRNSTSPRKSSTAKSAASTAASKASSAASKAAETAKTTAAQAVEAVDSTVSEAVDAVSADEPSTDQDHPSETTPEVDVDTTTTADPDAQTPDTNETKVEESPAAEAPAPIAAAEEPKQRSIFLPLVAGGVVAGALGYFVSEWDLLGTRGQSDEWRVELADQEKRLSTLESVEPPVIPEMPEVTFPELDTLTAEVTAMAAKVEDMDARLTEVEKRPITGGDSQVAVAAYERELAALQSSVQAQREEIEGLLDNALSVEEATEESARAARVQGAVTEIASAIGSGQPFAPAVEKLTAEGVGDVPEGLSAVAQDGVQTLNALQTRFPDSARAALGAARASGATEEESGFGGFLKRQLGARSVTPREGNDPDAVLSRAEAAVSEGRLNDALSEIEALPAPAQEAMQDWLGNARARQAAEAALQDLSQSLSAK